MFVKHFKIYLTIPFIVLSVFTTMAQSEIIIKNKSGNKNEIITVSESAKPAAVILKSYLDKAFSNPFLIEFENRKSEINSKIILELSNEEDIISPKSFIIKSDATNIYLIAPNEKYLRYAVYTLLEIWGFRKFTSKDNYIPKLEQVTFTKNTEKIHKPSFEYRALFYPDAYDEAFRDWHKLDWHLDDFGIWGHSFDKLLPPKEYFKTDPKLFALYEGNRRAESLCMTNDTVVSIITQRIQEIIKKTPNAQFYSVSQNDDAIYCECSECKLLNEKHGGPQGSLYYFLNKIAIHFPNTKFSTLAYLQTYQPPINLQIEPNIYTLFCPIDLNRGTSIANESRSKNVIKTLQNWNTATSHLYLWDYTVQFSNYLSPFPNLHTFADNIKLFKQNNVKGLFIQGYGDVPGDFSELRQYLLSKLLWDTEINIESTTDDFLRGFYGNAAPSIKKYLTLLTTNQQKGNQYLDIYSGPIQSRNTFLSPEAMNQYDQLINEASIAVKDDNILISRITKLRLALEYVYFEQSKFYGKDQHGMFIINEKGQKEVKKGLNERVREFSQTCKEYGIYELSEGGLSPAEYYKEWVEITKNTTNHLGENIDINFLTPPTEEFSGKGSYGLVDGVRGYKNFNINWTGWYGTNPEIELITKNLEFCRMRINFLDDQRHWIFTPKKITVYGFRDEKWQLIAEKRLETLTENESIKTQYWELTDKNFSMFTKLKLVIQNQQELPFWRQRKLKKPMVMLDEIELYKK
jgi:hypothetical protein